jgi:hypothetical protein
VDRGKPGAIDKVMNGQTAPRLCWISNHSTLHPLLHSPEKGVQQHLLVCPSNSSGCWGPRSITRSQMASILRQDRIIQYKVSYHVSDCRTFQSYHITLEATLVMGNFTLYISSTFR